MLVLDVSARLNSQAPSLGGRVQGAAELAALVRDNALPQVMPAAFVLPLGMNGQQADAATGAFRQPYIETVGIVLAIAAAGDITGAVALPEVQTVITETIDAIAGWSPGNRTGGFQVGRGALVSL